MTTEKKPELEIKKRFICKECNNCKDNRNIVYSMSADKSYCQKCQSFDIVEKYDITATLSSVEALITWHEKRENKMYYKLNNLLLLPLESPAKEIIKDLLKELGWLK